MFKKNSYLLGISILVILFQVGCSQSIKNCNDPEVKQMLLDILGENIKPKFNNWLDKVQFLKTNAIDPNWNLIGGGVGDEYITKGSVNKLSSNVEIITTVSEDKLVKKCKATVIYSYPEKAKNSQILKDRWNLSIQEKLDTQYSITINEADNKKGVLVSATWDSNIVNGIFAMALIAEFGEDIVKK
jgi:hypothetical protein